MVPLGARSRPHSIRIRNSESPGFEVLRSRLRRLAQGKRLPARNDFTPEDLRDCLPYVVLADVIPSSPHADFRLRVVGTEVCRMYGRELTGLRLSELLDNDWGRATALLFERAVRARTSKSVRTPFTAGRWRAGDLEVLVQPLAPGDGAPIDRLLVLHAFHVGGAIHGPLRDPRLRDAYVL